MASQFARCGRVSAMLKPRKRFPFANLSRDVVSCRGCHWPATGHLRQRVGESASEGADAALNLQASRLTTILTYVYYR